MVSQANPSLFKSFMDSGDNQHSTEEKGLDLSSRELLNMSAASLVFYLFIATILFYFFHQTSLFNAFSHGVEWYYQLLVGLAAGVVASGVIVFFSSRKPMGPILDDFAIFKIIKNTEFTWGDRIQISFFAGVGEELLFRGAIQPLIGIWVTSAVFVAIHGYISFKSAGHILFTALLFALSMMLGVLYETAGLLSAMTAHSVYDFLMLWWVKGRKE